MSLCYTTKAHTNQAVNVVYWHLRTTEKQNYEDCRVVRNCVEPEVDATSLSE